MVRRSSLEKGVEALAGTAGTPSLHPHNEALRPRRSNLARPPRLHLAVAAPASWSQRPPLAVGVSCLGHARPRQAVADHGLDICRRTGKKARRFVFGSNVVFTTHGRSPSSNRQPLWPLVVAVQFRARSLQAVAARGQQRHVVVASHAQRSWPPGRCPAVQRSWPLIRARRSAPMRPRRPPESLSVARLAMPAHGGGSGCVPRPAVVGSSSLRNNTRMDTGEQGETSKAPLSRGVSRGVSMLDLILRVIAVVCTLASAIAMGTTNETLPLFTPFIQFKARYSDLPALTYTRKNLLVPDKHILSDRIRLYDLMLQLFELYADRFFVVANSVVSAYLILSLPLSVAHIIRSGAECSRLVLIIFDAAMLTLVTSASSAATAIVYLAHKGNVRANWLAICQQLDSFCERISGSLAGSFVAMVLLILLILLSAIALARRQTE
ncbi:Casparian strip membrane protein 2 [Hordeum vulgare]|nr:Casparian strip membrane protein 2 [Hordeum vulgare]